MGRFKFKKLGFLYGLFFSIVFFSRFSIGGDAAVNFMVDPFLGLRFDPNLVRFHEAPASMLKSIKPGDGKYWIFAEAEDPLKKDNRYIVISGVSRIESDISGRREGPFEPDFGAIVVCNTLGCSVVDALDNIFGESNISVAVKSSLLVDAVNKLICAFGGLDSLSGEMKAQIKSEGAIPRELGEHLVAAGVSVESRLVAEQ